MAAGSQAVGGSQGQRFLGGRWSCGQRSLGRLQEEPLPGWTAHPGKGARLPGQPIYCRGAVGAPPPSLGDKTQPREARRDKVALRALNAAVFVTHSSEEGDSSLRPSTELGPGIIPTPGASRGRNRTGLCQGAGGTVHGWLLPAGTWRSVTPSSSALPGHCHPASSTFPQAPPGDKLQAPGSQGTTVPNPNDLPFMSLPSPAPC